MTEIAKLHRQFCNYSLTFKGNTVRGVKWFESCFNRLQSYKAISKLEQLDQSLLEDWLLYGKIERDWSAKTIRNYLQGISSFLKWCVYRKFIAENPAENIPKPKLPDQISRALSLDDAETLMFWAENIPSRYRYYKVWSHAVIATFLYTGVRLDELRNLKVGHLNLKNKTLFVASGKGSKDRLIPLNFVLIQILNEFLKHRERLNKQSSYFFVPVKGDAIVGHSALKRLIIEIRNRSGIYFTPHMLRHTFATLMLEGGTDIFKLKTIMGHSDIKTTERYLRATTKSLQLSINKHPLGL